MTPQQRAAALRLADRLSSGPAPLNDPDLNDEAAALLRELAAEHATVKESLPVEPAPGYCPHCRQYTIAEPLAQEPQAEPVAWIDSNGHPHHISAIQSATEKRLYGPWKPLYAHPQQQRKPLPWKPMRTAPRDGTAVLILMDGSDIPHAARWMLADDQRGSGAEGWHMTWDGYEISASSCRYWMQIPDDPDEAAHGITEAP